MPFRLCLEKAKLDSIGLDFEQDKRGYKRGYERISSRMGVLPGVSSKYVGLLGLPFPPALFLGSWLVASSSFTAMVFQAGGSGVLACQKL